jgi:hypothetical protein
MLVKARLSRCAVTLVGALRRIWAWLTSMILINGPRGSNTLGTPEMQPGSACSLPPVVDPARLEEFTPAALTDDQRVEMTTRCRDMDGVPRVPGAGHVQILPDQTCVQIMHNGIRVLADGYYGRWMTRLIELCHGCHDRRKSECSTR